MSRTWIGLFAAWIACAPGAPEGGAPGPQASAPDLSDEGAWRSGAWAYEHKILAKGSRSEGHVGVLTHRGVELRAQERGQYHVTPWGDLVWHGEAEVTFARNGWFPRDAESPVGERLPDPP